jgi:hypothetical protein
MLLKLDPPRAPLHYASTAAAPQLAQPIAASLPFLLECKKFPRQDGAFKNKYAKKALNPANDFLNQKK